MWKTQIAKIVDEGEFIPTTILELASGDRNLILDARPDVGQNHRTFP